MGERIANQPLTGTDRLTVYLYRGGLALAVAAELGGVAVGWGAAGASAPPLATALLLVGCAGIALATLCVHLYGRAFRTLLRLLLAVAVSGLGAAVVITGDPVGLYFGPGWGTLLGGPWVACHAALCLKEAYCFRLTAGIAAAVVAPIVVLAQAGGVGPVAGRLAGGLLFALLAGWVAVRKLRQPIGYDIGDKAAYE